MTCASDREVEAASIPANSAGRTQRHFLKLDGFTDASPIACDHRLVFATSWTRRPVFLSLVSTVRLTGQHSCKRLESSYRKTLPEFLFCQSKSPDEDRDELPYDD